MKYLFTGKKNLINIVVTSKPVDGLLHYSYEYCCLLNQSGIECNLVIITRGNYKPDHYIECLEKKYRYVENVKINDYIPEESDVSLILGRSMLTIAYREYNNYTDDQKFSLHDLFDGKLISVYSENDPEAFNPAIEFFKTDLVYDLCDHDVYPNGVGDHFEKTINFDLYKDPIEDRQFEHLFLGTNKQYYSELLNVVPDYPDHGILSYDEPYINRDWNNIFCPVDNLLGKFGTYVYNKRTFDPAPRLMIECMYYNKKVIYLRDMTVVDGGSVYFKRGPKIPDIKPIINAYEELIKNAA